MASYNIEMSYYNGSSYDVLYPKILGWNPIQSGSYTGTGANKFRINFFEKNENNLLIFIWQIIGGREALFFVNGFEPNSAGTTVIGGDAYFSWGSLPRLWCIGIGYSRTRYYYEIDGTNGIDQDSFAITKSGIEVINNSIIDTLIFNQKNLNYGYIIFDLGRYQSSFTITN